LNAIISNNTFKVTICDLKNKDRNMADNIEHQDKGELVANCDLKRRMRTTFEIQPYVFTENGVAMLSSVLRSDTAIEVNIRIMRAFTSMRHFLQNNAEVFQRLSTMEYHQLEMQQHLQESDKRIEDRFLCIDDDVYHIGASIKDLGKKWFGFSKMEILTPDELVEKINRE
jgi:hypothetical protein